MRLTEYIRILRKRWHVFVLFFAVPLAVAIMLAVLTPRSYLATAQVFVSISAADTPSQLAQGNTFAQARVQTYTNVATSPAVTEEVVEQLKLDISPRELASKISADAPTNQALINIHVKDSSATVAASLANAVAAQFNIVVEGLETSQSNPVSPVKLTVLQPATPPSGPISPNVTLYLGLGLVLGLALGAAMAILREMSDNTLKTIDQLSVTIAAPVLASIPFDKRALSEATVFREDPRGIGAEAYRKLRTNLQFINVDERPNVVAVTSAVPGEGKTYTALNLAAALAENGERVCLVEADLRRPVIAKRLGIVGGVGLTTLLTGQIELEDLLQDAGTNLSVISSGPMPPNPSELLASAHFRALLTQLSTLVDTVVVDTAPLLPVTDGAEVAAVVDATILVVRAGKTTQQEVKRALQILRNVGVAPVGAVLTMSSAKDGGDHDYGYGDYRPTEAPTRSDDLHGDRASTHPASN